MNGGINNAFYDDLGSRWYEAEDDPVALLRAESNLRGPWVRDVIKRELNRANSEPTDVLDIACGGGFLTNLLAKDNMRVTGIDLSSESLAVAARYDSTKSVRYVKADALAIPFPNASFDVVCAMDFLEHIDRPDLVIAEAARLVRPGGLFFFHTFSKNLLSRLLVIKGVEWFVKNTPPNMHVYDLFIDANEVSRMCAEKGLKVTEVRGVRPVIFQKAMFRLLTTREVSRDFRFKFVTSTIVSYSGYARRDASTLGN